MTEHESKLMILDFSREMQKLKLRVLQKDMDNYADNMIEIVKAQQKRDDSIKCIAIFLAANALAVALLYLISL